MADCKSHIFRDFIAKVTDDDGLHQRTEQELHKLEHGGQVIPNKHLEPSTADDQRTARVVDEDRHGNYVLESFGVAQRGVVLHSHPFDKSLVFVFEWVIP